MTSNINQVANNFLFDLVDVTQLSTKTLEDYSIVNRKHLEKIINNSERQLVSKTFLLFIYIHYSDRVRGFKALSKFK